MWKLQLWYERYWKYSSFGSCSATIWNKIKGKGIIQHQLELLNCRKGKANHYQMHLYIHFIIYIFLYHQAPNALYWHCEVIESNIKENSKVTFIHLQQRNTIRTFSVIKIFKTSILAWTTWNWYFCKNYQTWTKWLNNSKFIWFNLIPNFPPNLKW